MPTSVKEATNFTPLIDFWVAVYLIGLVCSKALLGIGMAGIAGSALYLWVKREDKQLTGIRVYLFPLIILVTALFSGLNSDNLAIWWSFIIKKLPFLVLPLSFFALREIMAKRFYDYLSAFGFIAGIVSLGVLGNYLMNFDSLNTAIGKGQAITTPIDHTEFSIFVAFAAVVSMLLYVEKRKVVRLGTRTTQLLLSIFLILFLHILAVRSGLAVLYACIIVVGIYYGLKEKQYRLLGILAMVLVLLPPIAINTLPSLKKKIGYVNWDLDKYRSGAGLNYSDSERIYSLRAGYDIFRENIVAGIGIGDMRAACDEKYMEYLGQTLIHYPHNQYLFTLASMGLLGFFFYMIGLLGPLFAMWRKMDPYFVALYVVILVSALAENTLERTFSIGFYLFFVLLSICFLNRAWDRQK